MRTRTHITYIIYISVGRFEILVPKRILFILVKLIKYGVKKKKKKLRKRKHFWIHANILH